RSPPSPSRRPASDPDATPPRPQAMIAFMGPEAAVNAVYFNKIQEIPEGPDRDAYVARLQAEYREDIDLMKLASELHVDAVVAGHDLRAELIRRFAYAENKIARGYPKRRSVTPV